MAKTNSNERPYVVVTRYDGDKSVIKYGSIEDAHAAILESIKHEVYIVNDDYDSLKEDVNKMESGSEINVLDYDPYCNVVWELY